MRASLAPLATALLIVWAIGVAGAFFSHTVDWTLFGAAVALLVVRRVA